MALVAVDLVAARRARARARIARMVRGRRLRDGRDRLGARGRHRGPHDRRLSLGRWHRIRVRARLRRKGIAPLACDPVHAPARRSATCKHCHAPIAFARDKPAAICPYCGGDNYREALARLLQTDASTQEQAASDSLLDAVRELDDRRDMLFSIIGCAAIVRAASTRPSRSTGRAPTGSTAPDSELVAAGIFEVVEGQIRAEVAEGGGLELIGGHLCPGPRLRARPGRRSCPTVRAGGLARRRGRLSAVLRHLACPRWCRTGPRRRRERWRRSTSGSSRWWRPARRGRRRR